MWQDNLNYIIQTQVSLGQDLSQVIPALLIFWVFPGISYQLDIWLAKPFCAVEVWEAAKSEFLNHSSGLAAWIILDPFLSHLAIQLCSGKLLPFPETLAQISSCL